MRDVIYLLFHLLTTLAKLMRDGVTPVTISDQKIVDINKYRWERHCRGLLELPIAA